MAGGRGLDRTRRTTATRAAAYRSLSCTRNGSLSASRAEIRPAKNDAKAANTLGDTESSTLGACEQLMNAKELSGKLVSRSSTVGQSASPKRKVASLDEVICSLRKNKGKKLGSRVPQRIPEASVLKTLRDRPPSERVEQRKNKHPGKAKRKVEESGTQSRSGPDAPETPSNSNEPSTEFSARGENDSSRECSRSSAETKPRRKTSATTAIWGKHVTKRRSSLLIREVPVTAGFHILNVTRALFQPTQQPHSVVYPVAHPWEPFELPEAELECAQTNVHEESALAKPMNMAARTRRRTHPPEAL